MTRLATAATIWLLSLTAASAQDDPYPPGASELTPQTNLHLEDKTLVVPPRFAAAFPENATLRLPPGFEVSVFASAGLGNPRELVLGPDGIIYVADASGGGQRDSKGSRVLALPDRDGDGVVDEVVVVADQLSMCYSIDFHEGELYASETHQVVRLVDADGDGFYETHEVVVPNIPDVPPGAFHTSRNMVIDGANERLFVQVGSPCDLCRQEEPVIGYNPDPLPQNPEFGTILVANLDGTGRRIFASGIRNVVGMDIHPVTGELWATHNHYDLAGSEVPPEWIDIVRDGDFMGFPFVHGWRAWVDFQIPDYQKLLPITRADSQLVATHKRPVALVNAHLAPMAIHFYRGNLFPPSYRHAGLVAIRGGQTPGNLAVVEGFKVIAVFSEPDGSNAQIADFFTGFASGGNVWGKPVGLAEDRAGNLYVASNSGIDAIYRIGFSPILATLEHNLPESLPSGTTIELEGTVRILRLGEDAGAPVLTVDLSALGGPEALFLEAVGDSTYRFSARIVVDVANGPRELVVRIVQGPYSNRLVDGTNVLPTADVVAMADGPAPGWTIEHSTFATVVPRQSDVVFAGKAATSIEGTASGIAGWRVELVAPESVSAVGFRSLRFAFHPGTAEFEGRSLSLGINNPTQELDNGRGFGQFALPSRPVDLLAAGPDGEPWVDVTRREWQLVDVPLAELRLSEPLERIRFFGNVRGRFFIDELRMVTPGSSFSPGTAVGDEPRPESFELAQNYPNPFNSRTLIPFRLATAGEVELAVYDMTGQRVASLIESRMLAGAHTASWNGMDDRGRPVASGVYVYRLRATAGAVPQVVTRKLLLIR
jgi:glucose/arabinose dehydrogenase